MRSLALLIALLAACLAALPARAQTAETFEPGWYVVEKAARFAVLLPTMSDARAMSEASKAGAPFAMQIGVGEVVVAFAKQGEVYFCFESTGRVSAIRGKGSLTPAAKGGTPAVIVKPFEASGRKLMPGSSVWIVATAASGKSATIEVEGDTRLEVPSDSLRFLGTLLADSTADKEWARAK